MTTEYTAERGETAICKISTYCKALFQPGSAIRILYPGKRADPDPRREAGGRGRGRADAAAPI